MAILKKGLIYIDNKQPNLFELNRELRKIPDGEYSFFICNKKKNKQLPRLKYLYSVILKQISLEYKEKIPTEVLYRKFEKMFAPKRTTRVFGNEFVYQDLKNCNASEMDEVIKQIIKFASENLGIKTIERLSLQDTELTAPYVDAYNDQWKDYNRNV